MVEAGGEGAAEEDSHRVSDTVPQGVFSYCVLVYTVHFAHVRLWLAVQTVEKREGRE